MILKDTSIQSWSIIVFGYNEKETLASVIEHCEEVLHILAPESNEIIIVDDGSNDGSDLIIQDLSKKYSNIIPHIHPQNLGIGSALKSGYRLAGFENFCAIPADGQFHAGELIRFSCIPDKTFVSFYRVDKTSYSVFRKLLTIVNKNLNLLLFGISLKDVNWVKIYKRDQLSKLNLSLTSSLVESEICIKLCLLGNKARQVKSVYHPRIAGKSKGSSFKIIVQALRDIYQLNKVIRQFTRSDLLVVMVLGNVLI